MVVQIGIVVATYLGVRLYEKIKRENFSQEDNESLLEKSSNLSIAQDYEADKSQNDNDRKSLQHYSRASVASMGLLAVRGLLPIAGRVGLIAYSYATVPYMKDVEKMILNDRKANIGLLFFLIDVLAVGSKFYFTAAVGLWMMLSTKIFVETVKADSRTIINSIFSELPQKVWVLIDDVEVEVPLEKVKDKDVVIMNAGGVIPFAGRITEGVAGIFQQTDSGEFQIVEKRAGDTIFAKMFILTGRIRIQVEKL